MPTSLFQYEMLPTTWFYLSALIILAMFFKFNRFWSVRNLDLIGLILLTPGLLWLAMRDDPWGYAWLLSIGLLMIVRLFFDTVMVRRPLLEPNLTPGGLAFASFFLVCFVVAALAINRGDVLDSERTVRLEQILTTRHIQKEVGMTPKTMGIPKTEWENIPPGFRPFWYWTELTNLVFAPPPSIRLRILNDRDSAKGSFGTEEASGLGATLAEAPLPDSSTATKLSMPPSSASTENSSSAPVKESGQSPLPTPRLLSSELLQKEKSVRPEETPIPAQSLRTICLVLSLPILAHVLLALGFITIGHCHFGNIRTGIACATLYFLLPYTNQMIGRIDHVIPGALILWGVVMYRRPFFSGLLIGAAAAIVFYPIFLVPLWCSFYWKRGCFRFLSGFALAMGAAMVCLCFSPTSFGSYGEQVLHLFGKSGLWIFDPRPEGIWNSSTVIYRIPVLAIYVVFCFGLILWPSRKHLATLLSCSTLLMLGVQYCQIYQGGLYMAWYLPLLILTIFRPNLEDRVAQSTVSPFAF